jgi:hypothetical protein
MMTHEAAAYLLLLLLKQEQHALPGVNLSIPFNDVGPLLPPWSFPHPVAIHSSRRVDAKGQLVESKSWSDFGQHRLQVQQGWLLRSDIVLYIVYGE